MPARADVSDHAAFGGRSQTAFPCGGYFADHLRCADALSSHNVVVDHQPEVFADGRTVHQAPSLDRAFLWIAFASHDNAVVLRPLRGVTVRIFPDDIR